MLVQYPTNIDYLIPQLRFHIGDYDGTRFSDIILRTALIAGIIMLERRWDRKYVTGQSVTSIHPLPENVYYWYEDVTDTDGVITIVPSGYEYVKIDNSYTSVPSGLDNGDVVRNPRHTFTDDQPVISEYDQYIVILAAVLALQRMILTSSAESFQHWSTRDYTFSNLEKSRVLSQIYENAFNELNAFFKGKLAGGTKSSFPYIVMRF